VTWGWARRNVANDAHPPRLARKGRKGRKGRTVAQLRTFLQRTVGPRLRTVGSGGHIGHVRCELAGEADRQVANTLAALIIGGSLATVDITSETGTEDADGMA
jgi:hypothetical protein